MNTIAYLYRIPSRAANVPDRIVIRDHRLDSCPGAWLCAELPLPAGFTALETEYGDGFIVTDTGEAITAVYPGKSLIIDGSAYLGYVNIYAADGRRLIRKRLRWY